MKVEKYYVIKFKGGGFLKDYGKEYWTPDINEGRFESKEKAIETFLEKVPPGQYEFKISKHYKTTNEPSNF